MARIIGYRRISKAEAGTSGLGLDAQASAIESAAQRLGLPLAQTFTDDGFSGSLPLEDRPGLLAAIGALRRGDVLLVAKRDRLGRDVINVALAERLIERKGARILSASGEGNGTTAGDRLQRTIIDAFAAHERNIIIERTKAALSQKRIRGERISGRLPFGFALADDGIKLVPREDEQRILARARDLRDRGLTLDDIARALNADGLTTRSGAAWIKQYVGRILRAGQVESSARAA